MGSGDGAESPCHCPMGYLGRSEMGVRSWVCRVPLRPYWIVDGLLHCVDAAAEEEVAFVVVAAALRFAVEEQGTAGQPSGVAQYDPPGGALPHCYQRPSEGWLC